MLVVEEDDFVVVGVVSELLVFGGVVDCDG